ncbi:hypothetical protein ACFL16_02885 [Patescibacteria group bacterium]
MFAIWAAIAAGTTVLMGMVFNRNRQIGGAIFSFLLFYLISWMFLPALAFDMLQTWVMFTFVLGVSAAITGFGYGQEKIGVFFVPGAVLLVMVFGMFFTSGVFNASEMANVLSVTDHGQKETTIELASQEQALRVTPDLATKRAAELIGSAQKPGLASIAKYGTMYGNIMPDGKAVWMAPLEPNGFWKWLFNSVTPGYFVCSHVNSMDSELIENQPIAYGPGFYWGHDLERHLYMNGYVNYIYGEIFFQVDNEEVPHYVVSLERPQVGFWSDFPEKWVVVNAKTGKIDPYDSHDSLPSWIDRAYPGDTMIDRLDDWGCFSAGAWACYVSGVNVIKPTPGHVVTMDSVNKMIYYTGTQFENNKSGGATSGVATFNSRTGKADFYRRAGITETEAVKIMNGAVSNFNGWSAEKPVLIQINGIETYFSVITDESGARKSYGMVWQRSRDVYGIGKSVEDAVRSYLRSARSNKSQTAFEGHSEIDSVSFNGLVVTITPVTRGGETSFYLRLDTVNDKVFVVNTNNPAEVATTKVGEPVCLTALNVEPSTVEVDKFDNLSINLAESAAQVKLNTDTTEVMRRYQEVQRASDVKAKLNTLSPEQVNELLKALE